MTFIRAGISQVSLAEDPSAGYRRRHGAWAATPRCFRSRTAWVRTISSWKRWRQSQVVRTTRWTSKSRSASVVSRQDSVSRVSITRYGAWTVTLTISGTVIAHFLTNDQCSSSQSVLAMMLMATVFPIDRATSRAHTFTSGALPLPERFQALLVDSLVPEEHVVETEPLPAATHLSNWVSSAGSPGSEALLFRRHDIAPGGKPAVAQPLGTTRPCVQS